MKKYLFFLSSALIFFFPVYVNDIVEVTFYIYDRKQIEQCNKYRKQLCLSEFPEDAGEIWEEPTVKLSTGLLKSLKIQFYETIPVDWA